MRFGSSLCFLIALIFLNVSVRAWECYLVLKKNDEKKLIGNLQTKNGMSSSRPAGKVATLCSHWASDECPKVTFKRVDAVSPSQNKFPCIYTLSDSKECSALFNNVQVPDFKAEMFDNQVNFKIDFPKGRLIL